MSTLAPIQTEAPSVSRDHWLDRIDDWTVRVGDTLNPILIKETRQALKSRQFVITFSVLLFAALAWTIVGSLSMMPQIYTSPSAPRMLIGYYLVLALPMLLVVPLAAYRSLEGEIDDGTLELLSITTLSPWQIVLGKLASAMLQMALYFVALVPCVAYAYTLRGVDLPTTLLILGVLLVAGVMLTIIALFFAPLSKSRTGRISTLLATMSVLIGAGWGLAVLMISMILYGNPLSGPLLFYVVVSVLLISMSAGHLLLTATAAQLTPESENRSTHIRLALLLLTAVALGLGAMGIELPQLDSLQLMLTLSMFLAVIWAICGSMMAAESPTITPRVRRELPSSFAARCLLTWLTPGPTSGLAFAAIGILVIASFLTLGFDYPERPRQMEVFRSLVSITAAYLVGMLVTVRWIIAVVRRTNNPRVELGIAALVAVAVLGALLPYSIGLHLNDYRPFSYTYWQVTNWAWTLRMVSGGVDLTGLISFLVIVSMIALILTLLASPELVMPRRTATPSRVRKELDAGGVGAGVDTR